MELKYSSQPKKNDSNDSQPNPANAESLFFKGVVTLRSNVRRGLYIDQARLFGGR
jgi:hypothetical protein